jgi:hypothetical protein
MGGGAPAAANPRGVPSPRSPEVAGGLPYDAPPAPGRRLERHVGVSDRLTAGYPHAGSVSR